jgi:NADH-quinone oxidoreductase subunit N
MPPTVAVPTVSLRDFAYLGPEIVLTAWGLLVLIADFAFLRRATSGSRRTVLGVVSLVGVLAALAVNWLNLPASLDPVHAGMDPYLFFGTIAGDALTSQMNYLVLGMMALVLAMSMAWDFTRHWGEYYALLLWAAVGMMLLIAAEELLTLFLTLETMTLCLYLATAFEKDRRRSAEGGLKYFVYGSVSSALFLFGLSLIYGMTGTTRLEGIRTMLSEQATDMGLIVQTIPVGLAGNIAGATAVLLVLVGFGFKIAAVPFHQWAPDAYEGAPAPVTAWIASGSKVASFIALMKVLVYALAPWRDDRNMLSSPGWIGVVTVISAATMTYGNFAALAQRNLKRMLAYSSIAHAGYMLVGVLAASVSQHNDAAASVLYYLVVYGFTTVGAFALAAWLVRDKGTDEIEDLNGLGFQAPGLAVCIVLLMLSLIGMPPLAGFFGKLYMFMEALNAGERGKLTLTWLVALGLANSVVSAFYYVRVLKAMFLRTSGPGRPLTASATAGIRLSIVLATLVAVGFGVAPAMLMAPMSTSALAMVSMERRSTRYTSGAVPAAPTKPPEVAPVPPNPRP